MITDHSSYYAGKRVMVTGAAGTIGSALVETLTQLNPAELRAIDINESDLFGLDVAHADKAECILADVRDIGSLNTAFKGIDIVFHAGALKHVPLCERSPMEAVRTNILGVQNVIQAAINQNVERVIYTSSDKAVNPTSVMGTSKLMGEQLMNAANLATRGKGPVFASTRFGNVLGSRGSVVPVFAAQIKRGGPVRLTSTEMTRFVMSRNTAVQLVLSAASMAKGGDVLITKMEIVRIEDLAKAMIQLLAPKYGYEPEDIAVEIIGARPGEKMYEELMNVEEVRRSVELEQMFAILPAVRDLYRGHDYSYEGTVSNSVDRPYNSANEPPMPTDQVAAFLQQHNILEEFV